MLMQGVEVNLPQTTTKNIKTKEEPLMLTVNKEKEIFIEKHRIKLDNLEIKIQKIFQNRKDKEILLRADKEVPYGFVIKVIAKVKQAGIDKLGMVTVPLDWFLWKPCGATPILIIRWSQNGAQCSLYPWFFTWLFFPRFFSFRSTYRPGELKARSMRSILCNCRPEHLPG